MARVQPHCYRGQSPSGHCSVSESSGTLIACFSLQLASALILVVSPLVDAVNYRNLSNYVLHLRKLLCSLKLLGLLILHSYGSRPMIETGCKIRGDSCSRPG